MAARTSAHAIRYTMNDGEEVLYLNSIRLSRDPMQTELDTLKKAANRQAKKGLHHWLHDVTNLKVVEILIAEVG